MLEIKAMKLSDYEEVVSLWTETKKLGFSPQFDTKTVIDTYLKRNPECSSALGWMVGLSVRRYVGMMAGVGLFIMLQF